MIGRSTNLQFSLGPPNALGIFLVPSFMAESTHITYNNLHITNAVEAAKLDMQTATRHLKQTPKEIQELPRSPRFPYIFIHPVFIHPGSIDQKRGPLAHVLGESMMGRSLLDVGFH